MSDIITVPLSYLKYYHGECLTNPHYSNEYHIEKQKEIIEKLEKKNGIGEDHEVAMKSNDMKYFQLHA